MEEEQTSDSSPPADGPGLPPDAFSAPPPSGGGGFELPESLAFLRNRFILAGLGLLAVLLLVTIVLVAIGSSDESSSAPPQTTDSTPVERTAVPPSEGLPGRVLNTAILRNGPSTSYAVLGTIPRGAQVAVVGRNEDNTWLQVVPAASGLRGWVEVDFVDVTGNLNELAVAGPGSRPSISVPTRIVVPSEDEEPVVPTSPPVRPTATQPPATATTAPPTAPPPTQPPPTPTGLPAPTPTRSP